MYVWVCVYVNATLKNNFFVSPCSLSGREMLLMHRTTRGHASLRISRPLKCASVTDMSSTVFAEKVNKECLRVLCEYVCVCVYVVRKCVCVIVRVNVCVRPCENERERESVCVCGRVSM